MEPAVVHRGWLLKRSGLLKTWQKRYFALLVPAGQQAPCLVYGPGPNLPWAGSLPLGGATCGPLSRGEGHPEAACFCASPVAQATPLPLALTVPTTRADIHRDGATYVLGAVSEGAAAVLSVCSDTASHSPGLLCTKRSGLPAVVHLRHRPAASQHGACDAWPGAVHGRRRCRQCAARGVVSLRQQAAAGWGAPWLRRCRPP